MTLISVRPNRQSELKDLLHLAIQRPGGEKRDLSFPVIINTTGKQSFLLFSASYCLAVWRERRHRIVISSLLRSPRAFNLSNDIHLHQPFQKPFPIPRAVSNRQYEFLNPHFPRDVGSCGNGSSQPCPSRGERD